MFRVKTSTLKLAAWLLASAVLARFVYIAYNNQAASAIVGFACFGILINYLWKEPESIYRATSRWRHQRDYRSVNSRQHEKDRRVFRTGQHTAVFRQNKF
jgi:hypothetical protein